MCDDYMPICPAEAPLRPPYNLRHFIANHAETLEYTFSGGYAKTPNLRTAHKWPQLVTLVKVQSERYLDDKHSLETRYYISSLAASAETVFDTTRTHWAIENSLHWVLDIAFREDESRLRKDNGAQNFAVLRYIALNLLKQDDMLKVGVKNKRLRTGWDKSYLLTVLRPLFTLQ